HARAAGLRGGGECLGRTKTNARADTPALFGGGGVPYSARGKRAARRTRRTVYRARRGRLLLGTLLALLLAVPALAAARHLLDDKARMLNDKQRMYVSAVRWPQQGQAAFVLGNGRSAVSPHEQPAPIARLAKGSTAHPAPQ